MALRCFVSVEFPESLKQEIGRASEPLKRSGADVKWVSPGNLHITLKFLGHTEEAQVQEIITALQKKIAPYNPFYITITGIGCFPEKRHPRIIWAGVEDSALLRSLQQDVEDEMAGLGYPREKRAFSPHLTIGRMRSQRKASEIVKRLEEYRALNIGAMEINEVSLMKSALKPSGAEYSTVAEISLRRRNDVK